MIEVTFKTVMLSFFWKYICFWDFLRPKSGLKYFHLFTVGVLKLTTTELSMGWIAKSQKVGSTEMVKTLSEIGKTSGFY